MNIISSAGKRLKKFLSREIDRQWDDEIALLSAKAVMTSDRWCGEVSTDRLWEKEFRVFSQFGDDGLIQYLIYKLQLKECSFVEFGVADYFESNTRFLLMNNFWPGLVIDGSQANISELTNSPIYWKYPVTAKQAFITRDNINELLEPMSRKPIGFLHIDLDGMDYWIFEALDMDRYRPDILVIEYNGLFGVDKSLSVPYDQEFNRLEVDNSGIYQGASLRAIYELAVTRDYHFVGCNLAGNNAYFISQRCSSFLEPISIEQGFREPKFSEYRSSDGQVQKMNVGELRGKLEGTPVYNLKTGEIEAFEASERVS